MSSTSEREALLGSAAILDAADAAFSRVLTSARVLTEHGRRIDEHQVLAERIALVATHVHAAHDLLGYAEQAAQDGREAGDARLALSFAAEVAQRLASELNGPLGALDGSNEARAQFEEPAARDCIAAGLSVDVVTSIGANVIAAGGVNHSVLEDEAAALTRTSVRAFARTEVAPLAQELHRRDLLVPEELIEKMARLGLFAASIPERYGGSGLGYLAMVVTTEELSAASLVVGSLSTRPEILARALLVGGTEGQRASWLSRLASGEIMVAIAVTEPDAGSDVASLTACATPAVVGGQRGFALRGAKAWSTFAGRADVIAMLARTNPDPSAGARGLSLFIVEKSRHFGHAFEERQPTGGVLRGDAIPTPGYRGMHSFVLSFDDFFVPEEMLVGASAGRDRGFYLQLSGFAAGRLQTAGRALGVTQAALEQTAAYVQQRQQFGRAIGDYELTRYTIGQVATRLAAARQLTYAAARAIERAERDPEVPLAPREADLLAAMAKLFACDVAVWATQECQMLHGGWGYAEESLISRLVVDAQVLPIFEGTRPILALKVIGQALLRDQ